MADSGPFFSVLIPSYNRPEYLPLAVRSVLGSDFSDFELIVSDDKSPRQPEIIEALSRYIADSRLLFVPQPQNLGEARNRHFLMEKARGKFRIILGDDDLLEPHALSTLFKTIQERPGFDVYLFGYSIIDEDNRVFETRRALQPVEISLSTSRSTRDLLFSDLFPFWLYHPATFCFPASLHRDVVPNHSVGIGDDLIFMFDAVIAGKRALVVPAVLFSYRKFIGPRTYSQGNLSKLKLANVVTRRHILYNLLERRNLPGPIGELVQSYEFRRRFLYDSLVIDSDATEAFIGELKLAPEHLREAREHWQKHRGRWYAQKLQLKRVVRYACYFGVPGAWESLKVFRQRRSYRRSIATSA